MERERERERERNRVRQVTNISRAWCTLLGQHRQYHSWPVDSHIAQVSAGVFQFLGLGVLELRSLFDMLALEHSHGGRERDREREGGRK